MFECCICEKPISFGDIYYALTRMLYKKKDGYPGHDEILYDPMPEAILIACKACMLDITSGNTTNFGPFQLYSIEKSRITESYFTIEDGNDAIPRARGCSICGKYIEDGTRYLRIHLSKEVAHDQCIEQLAVDTIGILCSDCIKTEIRIN